MMIALILLAASAAMPRSTVEPLTRMRFVLIPAGAFMMGSPADEPGHQPSEALHRVTIRRPFYLGAREVTQREWAAVMGSNPSHFRGAELPVEEVNWFEVHEFIRRLNARGAARFRLPTEAEWEYACRAGTSTPYAFGRTLSTKDANYDGRYPLPGQAAGRYRGRTVAAGSLRANAWGLYDMHGNVWEWCEDAFDRERKVIRGGSWYFNAESARSALRYHHRPQDRGFSLGFRLVREW
jgi:formylglycine-generating enzyme required for sulfatase activity